MSTSYRVYEDRIPHNIEAELALLGSCLLGDADAIDEAADILAPADFYREANAKIFDAMLHLRRERFAVDAVTLKDELERRGLFPDPVGVDYLISLGDIVPTAAHAAHYARIVRQKAILRKLIEEGAHISGVGYSDPENLDEALADVERRVLSIAGTKDAGAFAPLSACLNEAMDALDQRFHHGNQIIGVPTGFTRLDYITSGLRQGDLIILAARPGMGKTAFAAQIAANAALRYGKRVAFFSLEMGKQQITDRILCAEALVDSHRYATGQIDDAEWRRLNEANGRLWEAQIFLDDSPDATVRSMRSRLRRLQAETGGVDLVCLDYLQLMRPEGIGRPENRVHEVTEMARGLKSLAREFDVPLVALCQLSRAVERREDKRPILSDLRDSGGIEEAADVISFLYRAAYYDRSEPEAGDAAQEVEVHIAKHRKGPTGFFKAAFLPEFVRFDNLAEEMQ